MISYNSFEAYNDTCGCSEKCPIPIKNNYINSNYVFSIPLLGEEIEDYICNIYCSHCRPPILSEEVRKYYSLDSRLDLDKLIGKEVRIIKRKVNKITGMKIDGEYHAPLSKIINIDYHQNIKEYRFLKVIIEDDNQSINPSRIILPTLDIIKPFTY